MFLVIKSLFGENIMKCPSSIEHKGTGEVEKQIKQGKWIYV
jgi:hypothetical protein